MTSSSQKSASTTQSDQSELAHPLNWMDRLARIQTHFGRFLWDILGVFCFSFALMTLLGILKLSKGTLLEEWISLLYLWFGWGQLMVVLLAVVIGVLAFRRSRKPLTVQWGRVISLEIAAFMTLAVLSVISSNTLTTGHMWGGEVGWGLAQLIIRIKFIGPIWGGVIIFILWGLALLTGLGLWRSLEIWFLQQAGEPVTLDTQSPNPEAPVISPLVAEKTALFPGVAVKKLPRNFRQNSASLLKSQRDKIIAQLRHHHVGNVYHL